MGRQAATFYGAFCYGFALAVILYAFCFVEGLLVPKTIDSGPAGAVVTAVVVDLGLLGLFAIQHSFMARQDFKRWWTKIVPEPIERSTYVLLSSAALTLLFVFWRPMPSVIWSVGGLWALALWGLSGLGWATALYATFLIDHFDLFGLKQVGAFRDGRAPASSGFREPSLYKVVRHPLYTGFLLAFWAAPLMTLGHLIFAIIITVYIVVAVQFEERDLVDAFGDTYRDYRRRVSMLVPWFPKKSPPTA